VKYKPHQYQTDAIKFLYENKNALLFADMGTGKTSIVLYLLHLLFANRESQLVKGVLVIAPLRVCQLTWPMEIAKWDFCKGFTHTLLHGKNKKNIVVQNDIYLMNYEGIAWLVEYLKNNPCPFDIIIFDEISKLKDPTTKRFRALKKIIPLFDRRIGLTGTPTPNSYMNLFSLMYSIDEGETLGKHITHYRDRFFDKSYNGFTYTLKAHATKEIDNLIAPFVFRIEASNPVPITYMDINVVLPKTVMGGYKKLEKEFFLKFDDALLKGVNAAVLLNKLRQYVGGAVYTEDKSVKLLHDRKIRAVGKISGPCIIAYVYRHELDRLNRRYPEAVDFSKGDQNEILKRWNRGEISKLLIQPASMAHGLNLQFGGATLVWFTLTWSLEQYLQANARIWRQGQENPVEIYHIMVDNTVDVIVKAVLESKSNKQIAFLKAMKYYRDNLLTGATNNDKKLQRNR